MMRAVANCYTNGTSALKMTRPQTKSSDATIIAFPKTQNLRSVPQKSAQLQNGGIKQQVTSFVKHVFESSEMYCSLRYESIKGCPYNKFSKAGIAMLSTGASCIAIVSLILGA